MAAIVHPFLLSLPAGASADMSISLSNQDNDTAVLQRRSSVRSRSNRHSASTSDRAIQCANSVSTRQPVLTMQAQRSGHSQPLSRSASLCDGGPVTSGLLKSDVYIPSATTSTVPSPPGLTPSDIHDDVETPGSSSHGLSDNKGLKFKHMTPNTQAYSQRITQTQWEKHRSFIEGLHHKGKPRPEILAILAHEKNFYPSKHQLNAQMTNVWKLNVYTKHNQSKADSDKTTRSLPTIDEQNLSPATITLLVDETESIEFDDEKLLPPTNPVTEASASVDITANLEQPRVNYDEHENYGRSIGVIATNNLMIGSEISRNLESSHNDQTASEVIHELPCIRVQVTDDSFHGFAHNVSAPPNVTERFIDSQSISKQCSNRISDHIAVVEQNDRPNFYNALGDVQHLMYACRMFSVAFRLSHLCYKELKLASRNVEHRLPFAKVNCVRSATLPEDIAVAKPIAAEIHQSCLQLPELLRCKLWLRFKQVVEEYNHCKQQVQSPSPTPESDLAAIFWDHHFILEHANNSKDQMVQVETLMRVAREWAMPLHNEACPVWEILSECRQLVQEYSGTISSDTLGCHFARKYACKILSFAPPDRIVLPADKRAAEIISFKSTIHAILVIAHWVTERLAVATSESCEKEDPASRIEQQLHALSNLPVGERASEFLRHQKAVYQVPLEKRKQLDCTSENISYIMDTAFMLANASVHLRNLVRYTWADPVLGETSFSATNSLRSGTSNTSLHRELARKGSRSSIKTHSSGRMSLCSHPSWRFSTVTGLSSNPSLRSTYTELMDIDETTVLPVQHDNKPSISRKAIHEHNGSSLDHEQKLNQPPSHSSSQRIKPVIDQKPPHQSSHPTNPSAPPDHNPPPYTELDPSPPPPDLPELENIQSPPSPAPAAESELESDETNETQISSTETNQSKQVGYHIVLDYRSSPGRSKPRHGTVCHID